MSTTAEPREKAGQGSSEGGRYPHATGVPASEQPASPHPAHAFGQAISQLGELNEYVSYFIATKLDAARASVRSLVIWIGVGIVGLLAAVALVATAVVLLLLGISQAISMAFPAVPWLGNLITGGALLLILAIGILVGMRKVTGIFKSSLVKKYENRQRQQRQRFGRDVQSPTGPTH